MLKNLALGMILGNDREMLERCVTKYDELFEHKYVVRSNCTDDGWAYLSKRGWGYSMPCNIQHYGQLRNELLGGFGVYAEPDENYEGKWLLMLDADECMFPSDLIALDELVETVTEPVIRLRRYNLAGPRFDWFDQGYPDLQARVIRLGAGVTFSGQVHEQAVVGHSFAHGFNAPFHIYHYGYCRDPRKIWLRHQNYDLLAAGQAPLVENEVIYPPDVDTYITRHALKPFNQTHPLAA